MNRAERRATGTHKPQRPGSNYRCTSDSLAAAIAAAAAAGREGVAELLRHVRAGRIALAFIEARAAIVGVPDLDAAPVPTVALVGDDDHKTTGPAGWACVPQLVSWAKAAVIHGSGDSAETYREAARAALLLGNCVLIETASAHAHEWAMLFAGRPTLLILPHDGPHPTMPPRGTMN